MTKREQVQTKAKELGHCCCSKEFKCPCNYFKMKDLCHCAGEDDCDYQEWLNINKQNISIG